MNFNTEQDEMQYILERIEKKIIELNVVKSKIRFAEKYPQPEVDIEIFRLNEELLAIKMEASRISDVKNQTSLLIRQLSEYIEAIQKAHLYSYSKKQSFGFDMFYISPIICVKNIVFSTQHGIAGAIYNLTLDEKDAVNDEVQFVDLLLRKRTEVSNLKNLCDLYEFYERFAEDIKREFLDIGNDTAAPNC